VTLSNDPVLQSYSETSVTQGQYYKFKISAMNVHGEGPLSDSLNLTPAEIPEVPTDIVLVSADETQITFSWTAPYNGGNDISAYRVYWD
jgi:hypothetical protein